MPSPVAEPMVRAVKDQESSAPLQFLILLVAGFLQRRQKAAIDYLLAENRLLRERRGPKRLRFTDAERRMLAEKGEAGRPEALGGDRHAREPRDEHAHPAGVRAHLTF